jgi:uncharacterized membrane protein YjgN (DUF898 family)
MQSISANGVPNQTVAPHPPQPLRFNGNGAEYFGIWIVNLLLTIVTLGIYSAWAKVRRLQYFYRHTELAGSGFDFHGSPIKILIGRVVALAMLIAYNLSIRMHSRAILIVLLILAIVMPWLLRNSFRFRLYNTSWRGTRFHFRGTVADSYRVFLLNGFLALITLYVMAPFMHQRLKEYQHDESWLGNTKFSFHATVGQFYLIYLVFLAAMVGFAVLLGVSGISHDFMIFAQMQKQGHADPALLFKLILIFYGSLILVGLLVGPIFHALIMNLIWSNTRVGENRIECNMSALDLIWITVSNFVLVILTLGLFIPWAAVRLARFQLECFRILPAGDLQEFEAGEPESVGAVGEEAASAFDFDISL